MVFFLLFSGDYAAECMYISAYREMYKMILLRHLFSRSLAVRLSFHSFRSSGLCALQQFISFIIFFRPGVYDHLFWCFSQFKCG